MALRARCACDCGCTSTVYVEGDYCDRCLAWGCAADRDDPDADLDEVIR